MVLVEGSVSELVACLQLDARVVAQARMAREHMRRRAFFLGFSHSPVDFINALIASQAWQSLLSTPSSIAESFARHLIKSFAYLIYSAPLTWQDEGLHRCVSSLMTYG